MCSSMKTNTRVRPWRGHTHTQKCWKSHSVQSLNIPSTHLTLSGNWDFPFSFPPLSLSCFLLYLSFPFLFLSFPPRSGCEGPVLDLIRRATNQVGIFFHVFDSFVFFILFFLKIPQNKTKKRETNTLLGRQIQPAEKKPTNPLKSLLKAL